MLHAPGKRVSRGAGLFRKGFDAPENRRLRRNAASYFWSFSLNLQPAKETAAMRTKQAAYAVNTLWLQLVRLKPRFNMGK